MRHIAVELRTRKLFLAISLARFIQQDFFLKSLGPTFFEIRLPRPLIGHSLQLYYLGHF